MANPRKFSEKIALHHQKQAEETAAFEAIMKEVVSVVHGCCYVWFQSRSTPGHWGNGRGKWWGLWWLHELFVFISFGVAPTANDHISISWITVARHCHISVASVLQGALPKKPPGGLVEGHQHLHIHPEANSHLGTYRGGSLPNVNAIDLQVIDAWIVCLMCIRHCHVLDETDPLATSHQLHPMPSSAIPSQAGHGLPAAGLRTVAQLIPDQVALGACHQGHPRPAVGYSSEQHAPPWPCRVCLVLVGWLQCNLVAAVCLVPHGSFPLVIVLCPTWAPSLQFGLCCWGDCQVWIIHAWFMGVVYWPYKHA